MTTRWSYVLLYITYGKILWGIPPNFSKYQWFQTKFTRILEFIKLYTKPMRDFSYNLDYLPKLYIGFNGAYERNTKIWY